MTSEEKKKMRTFGWGLAGLFAIFSIIRLVFRGDGGFPWQLYVTGGILLVNIALPMAIYPIYRGAMFIAHYLGWFNTRLLLGIIFFLVFTPMALILKLMGKDFLDRKIYRNAKSYWHKRERKEFDPSTVENQY